MHTTANIPLTGISHAGFWKRFAALTIDAVVLAGMGALLKLASAELWSELLEPDAPVAWLVTSFTVVLSICWSYWSGFESSPLQATPGKLAVGIYVTDLRGRRLDLLSASSRFFGKSLSALTLGLGFVMAGTTSDHQALHDRISGCLVLSR